MTPDAPRSMAARTASSVSDSSLSRSHSPLATPLACSAASRRRRANPRRPPRRRSTRQARRRDARRHRPRSRSRWLRSSAGQARSRSARCGPRAGQDEASMIQRDATPAGPVRQPDARLRPCPTSLPTPPSSDVLDTAARKGVTIEVTRFDESTIPQPSAAAVGAELGPDRQVRLSSSCRPTMARAASLPRVRPKSRDLARLAAVAANPTSARDGSRSARPHRVLDRGIPPIVIPAPVARSWTPISALVSGRSGRPPGPSDRRLPRSARHAARARECNRRPDHEVQAPAVWRPNRR